ncbi:hypothetical protein H6800_02635 [Candidatus Nomurabacteria bacterium]|nr:hypothetical protein [Candidatus Nomurabacteria bacterium]
MNEPQRFSKTVRLHEFSALYPKNGLGATKGFFNFKAVSVSFLNFSPTTAEVMIHG